MPEVPLELRKEGEQRKLIRANMYEDILLAGINGRTIDLTLVEEVLVKWRRLIPTIIISGSEAWWQAFENGDRHMIELLRAPSVTLLRDDIARESDERVQDVLEQEIQIIDTLTTLLVQN